MLRRYFPAIEATLIPHALPPPPPRKGRARQVVMMPDEDVPTVAILGAIGPDKGARRIERLASLAAERGVNLRLVVIGYLDRTQDAWQSDDGRLTVHGRYHPGDLPVLLDYYRVSLVLFPSAGPETFAFTLSEAWLAGRPVLVPPIGALPERVGEHGGGFVMDDAEWHDEGAMLDRILDLLSPAQAALTGSAAVQAHHIALPVASEMADSTARLYARAVTGSTQEHAPVDRLRVAEAFGYRAWSPPPRPSTLGDPVAASEGSLARVARRVRRSRFGAWLVRLMPPRAVAKLRARLF